MVAKVQFVILIAGLACLLVDTEASCVEGATCTCPAGERLVDGECEACDANTYNAGFMSDDREDCFPDDGNYEDAIEFASATSVQCAANFYEDAELIPPGITYAEGEYDQGCTPCEPSGCPTAQPTKAPTTKAPTTKGPTLSPSSSPTAHVEKHPHRPLPPPLCLILLTR